MGEDRGVGWRKLYGVRVGEVGEEGDMGERSSMLGEGGGVG